MLACRSVNKPKHVVRWYQGTRSFPWLHNHLPHMPAHSRQSAGRSGKTSQPERINLTAMFGQYIRGYFNN